MRGGRTAVIVTEIPFQVNKSALIARIAVARKRYIDRVAEYNKMVRYFPTNLTAQFLLHMEEKPNFTVADEKAVAKPPEVKF